LSSVSSLPINLLAVACLVMLAVVDWRTRRVPQIVTLPALAALGGWRMWRGEAVVFLLWLAAFSLYVFHICGAGDVKVLMIELALWPCVTFVVVLGITVAVAGTVVSVARSGGAKPFLRSMQIAGARLLSGHPPSEAELRSRGSPQVFLYVAGAVVYVTMLCITPHLLGRVYGG